MSSLRLKHQIQSLRMLTLTQTMKSKQTKAEKNFKCQRQPCSKSESRVLSLKETQTLKVQVGKLWKKRYSISMSNRLVIPHHPKFYKDLPDRTNRSTGVSSSKKKQHHESLKICRKSKIQSPKVKGNLIKTTHSCLNLNQSLISLVVKSHLIKVNTFNQQATRSQVNESWLDPKLTLENRL